MRQRPTRGRATARSLAALTAALVAAELPLDRAAHQLSFANSGFVLVIVCVFAAVGLLVIRRLPANPVGWLILAFGIIVVAGDCAGDYALLAYRYGEHSLPLRGAATTFAAAAAVAPILLLALPILLFPDGRLSRRWRTVVRVYAIEAVLFIAAIVAGSIVALGSGDRAVDGQGVLRAVDGAHGDLAWLGVVQAAALVTIVPVWIATVVRQVVRYRRARGVERVQLKWLLTGAAGSVLAAAYFASGVDSSSGPAIGVLSTVAGALLAALPMCMGVAILRYRLYDIDRLISRTLAYAIVTALLAGTFIGVVALSTEVLPLSGRVGVAASTLVAAALFNPLRLRVQRMVDRRFNRAHYDAQATVADFTARLRDAVELDTVRSELIATVRDAMQPTHISVWLR